jgi:hypothetical protein
VALVHAAHGPDAREKDGAATAELHNDRVATMITMTQVMNGELMMETLCHHWSLANWREIACAHWLGNISPCRKTAQGQKS